MAQLVIEYTPAIYLIGCLGLLFYLRSYFQARRVTRSSLYKLEREMAVNQEHRALIILFFLAGLLGATFAFSTYGRAYLPAAPPSTSPPVAGLEVTVVSTNIFLPKTERPPESTISTPNVISASVTVPVTGTLARSPTPKATAAAITPQLTPSNPPPSPSPKPTHAVSQSSGPCGNPHATITSPGNGIQVGGSVTVYGSADIDQFSFYKFELKGVFTQDQWNTLQVYHSSVTNSVLGSWDASAIAASKPGRYLFRLVVVDRTGNYPEPCTISLNIGTTVP